MSAAVLFGGGPPVTALHQFVHSYVDHDAISSHVRHLQRVIRGLGVDSEVFAGEWRGERSKATFFRDFDVSSLGHQDWVMYHLATASPMADMLQAIPGKLAVNYHNITPYEFLAPWEPVVAPELEVARRQLGQLSGHTANGIGVSHFNELEMQAAGYRNTTVAPILFDPGDFDRDIDTKLDAELRRNRDQGVTQWLFVGRITPHKCQHEIVRALAAHREMYGGKVRLHLVGGISSHRYWTVLRKYAELLDVEDAVDVTEGVSNAALGAYYRNADAFICLSEHEGFGVPVLEAMHNAVPVIGYDAAAVGETLGSGGMLLTDKSALTVAAAAHRVTTDDEVRKSMLVAGEQRLAEFSLSATEERWRHVLQDMLAQ